MGTSDPEYGSIDVFVRVAAVTNYHTLNGLHNTPVLFCNSGDQKSKMDLTGLELKGPQGCFPSEVL